MEKSSPYRFRKDVCYKFILRKFKNHYTKDFLEVTNFSSKHKSKTERSKSLQCCAVEYWKQRGLLSRSREFPFLLTALLFPKYSEEIIDLQISVEVIPTRRAKLQGIKSIIELLRRLKFSEVWLRKVLYISEVRYLLTNFIKQAMAGEVEISGMIKEDSEKDISYLNKIVRSFHDLIDAQITKIRNSNCK